MPPSGSSTTEEEMAERVPPPERPNRRRRRAIVLAICVVVACLLLAAMILPFWTGSHEFPVRTQGSGTSIEVKVPYPGYVTVRFAQHTALSMSYWVRGPGAMAGTEARSMNVAGATYAFWSWGGTYEVGAGTPIRSCGVPCYVPVSAEVWANVTTGLL